MTTLLEKNSKKIKFFGYVCLNVTLLVPLMSPTYSAFASSENKTLMQPQGVQSMSTNATNIVLVHGFWADGSSWSKVIPILRNAGHQVIAVQLPLHSVADDVATVKRALEQLKEPIILVGHSYGGFVITNAAYNNHNVTGLVYVAALAPNEGESLNDLVKTWPKEFLANGVGNVKPDSGGFLFIIPDKFHESFAQDVDRTEADIMAIVQKPPSQSMFVEKSGPPAWKQLRTWFQVSDNDRIIYPGAERNFAERMNATTLSLNSSHASLVSHPGEIAALILNATKGSTK
jgi:pimeloyl-ACP methyl ester carboxylesterase